MLHLVGDVSLAQKAGTHVSAHRKLWMEHLDREPLAIAVCRCVDGSHPADTENAVEAVLATQDVTDASLSAIENVVIRLGHHLRPAVMRRPPPSTLTSPRAPMHA
jgi:hypothetical protein